MFSIVNWSDHEFGAFVERFQLVHTDAGWVDRDGVVRALVVYDNTACRRYISVDPLFNSPYPHTKPRLRAAWERGFITGEKVVRARLTPCQSAFNGGAQRRIDMECAS